MRLLLVRHGSTVYNEEGRYTGQGDVPLSERGERQVILLGERLANEAIDLVVSSDLQRARATAEAIARPHALPVWEDTRLREIAFGAWEGATYTEVRERYADELELWHTDSAHFAPHGGETIIQARDRVVLALERWHSEYPDSTMVWVVHGGVIGTLLCHLLGVDLNRRWQFRSANASITTLGLKYGYRGVVLMSSNETAHLNGLK